MWYLKYNVESLNLNGIQILFYRNALVFVFVLEVSGDEILHNLHSLGNSLLQRVAAHYRGCYKRGEGISCSGKLSRYLLIVEGNPALLPLFANYSTGAPLQICAGNYHILGAQAFKPGNNGIYLFCREGEPVAR